MFILRRLLLFQVKDFDVLNVRDSGQTLLHQQLMPASEERPDISTVLITLAALRVHFIYILPQAKVKTYI